MDTNRALLGGRVPECKSQVHPDPVPTLRKRAMRAGLSCVRYLPQRRRIERPGI